MEPIRKPKGRPRAVDPANERIRIRVTPAEKAKYRLAAERARTTLTNWIKAILDRESS
jgi:uncharacterized protein (DUF1778 family)